MRARIHRGATEIGRNCIEIEQGEDRIVLDLSRPLSAGWDDAIPLPEIGGLASADPRMHGVVLSHPHLDHYGLASQLGADVPVYMGAEAAKLLAAAAFFSPISRSPAVTAHLSGPRTTATRTIQRHAVPRRPLCLRRLLSTRRGRRPAAGGSAIPETSGGTAARPPCSTGSSPSHRRPMCC